MALRLNSSRSEQATKRNAKPDWDSACRFRIVAQKESPFTSGTDSGVQEEFVSGRVGRRQSMGRKWRGVTHSGPFGNEFGI